MVDDSDENARIDNDAADGNGNSNGNGNDNDIDNHNDNDTNTTDNGIECIYSMKQTHYHCLICDCSVLSRAQLSSHQHK